MSELFPSGDTVLRIIAPLMDGLIPYVTPIQVSEPNWFFLLSNSEYSPPILNGKQRSGCHKTDAKVALSTLPFCKSILRPPSVTLNFTWRNIYSASTSTKPNCNGVSRYLWFAFIIYRDGLWRKCECAIWILFY